MAKKKVPRELSRALKLAGTQRTLAELLGVSPSTIRRWALKGVPQEHQEQLSAVISELSSRSRKKTSQRPQELLRKALRRVKGSLAELARELRVSPSTVRRWVKTKPSDVGAERLKIFLETQQIFQEAVKAERERLFELLGFHQRTIERIKEEIKVASGDKKEELKKQLKRLVFKGGNKARNGERTQGWQYAEKWGRELTSLFIQSLERWVRGLKRRYRYWQAIVRMLHFEPTGSREFKRSGSNVWMQIGEQEDFLIDASITTIRVGSRENLIGELRGVLEDVLEQGFYAYIVGITVFNYRLRTEKERRLWLKNKRFRQELKKKPRIGQKNLLLPPKTA